MSHYGYYCKVCGFSSMSKIRAKVTKAREVHRGKGNRYGWRRPCPMTRLENGHIARPDLAETIKKSGAR